ncbi:MAG: hypothetical protein U9Q96_00285 [Patescibacteria group bacterium]|nr:hypothetical protein [Patescibacteria group bacterium]
MNFKQKDYLSIFIIVIVFFSLLMFCIMPTLRSIIETSDELASRREELASVELLSQNFDDFEKNFLSYEQGLEEMENLLEKESLIDPEIPISFINFFKEQASDFNLALKISPMGFHEKKSEFWDYMNFRIEGTGRFVDIMRFLEKLENGRWLIEEISININREEDFKYESGKETIADGDYVEINLLIKAYVQS